MKTTVNLGFGINEGKKPVTVGRKNRYDNS
jgi:hypothetical protein